MKRHERHTGLCTYCLLTIDGWYVYAIDVAARKITTGGDHNIAAVWLKTPEEIEPWVAETQKLMPHARIWAERVRP